MKRVIGLGLATISLAGLGIAAELTPTGQTITPTAAPGARFEALNPDLPGDPGFTAGQASAMALSPDGKTLLVMTSGFNRTYDDAGKFIAERSNEYVFVYDVSGSLPVKRQVVQIANTFLGLAWAPAGDRFFVSGGVDDNVREYLGSPGVFKAGRVFPLGHKAGLGLAVKPQAAGLAISPDGKRLLVTNMQNDSVSLIDLGTGAVSEQDLRPGRIDPAKRGQAGGTVPRAVAWTDNKTAYVASQRDRQIIGLNIQASAITVVSRIAVRGQPNALLPARGHRLFVAADNTDAVEVIDTIAGKIVQHIPTSALSDPRLARLGGAGSNALALSRDGGTLLVSNGGENAVALIRLGPTGSSTKVAGLIPTGWYPTAVAIGADGKTIFAVNGKSNSGPAPLTCRTNLMITPASQNACVGANQYVWQKEKAGLLTLPTPGPQQLDRLTAQVASNNHWQATLPAEDQAKLAFLKAHIHHVIYVVKENRTYDQVLGDLEVGNGDPALTVFPKAMTPNQHALARQFVDLDNFLDSGESSNTGWNWTVAGRTNDYTEREAPVNYADRGMQYDQEGTNRNVNVGFATTAERLRANLVGPHDDDELPGTADVAAPDGPDADNGHGYIWDQALKAGLSVRNWGFYGDLVLYSDKTGPARIPRLREPWKTGVKVFTPANASLMAISDPYYRGFDQGFPDYWRFKAWEREFDGFVAAGTAPNLMMVRLPHDHTGDFAEGIDGINSVETELADNDYAVGLLVQKVAESPFAKDTLVLVIEDDAQDGPDHVDSHRSIAFVAGPYVKQGAVVSHRYDTVNLLRTIEVVLGLEPIGLTDALAMPMADVFDTTKPDWSFKAQVPGVLRTTTLPLPPAAVATAGCPARSRTYWAHAMAGQDFSSEDRLDTSAFNRALWRGLKGEAPYPKTRLGQDLRQNRAALLAKVAAGC